MVSRPVAPLPSAAKVTSVVPVHVVPLPANVQPLSWAVHPSCVTVAQETLWLPATVPSGEMFTMALGTGPQVPPACSTKDTSYVAPTVAHGFAGLA